MKFKINKTDFLNVLGKVQGLTARKSTIAITSCVLMESAPNGLRLMSTDLETGLEGFYDAQVFSGGRIALNAKKLFEITRDFPSDDVLVSEIENYWIEIGDSNVEYHIVGLNPDDFPNFPLLDTISFFDMPSETVRRMIDQNIVIGYGGDEKRAHITGVLFEIINGENEKLVRIVSTDGNRLSAADCTFDAAAALPESTKCIIPKKGLAELNKFLASEGTVQVGFNEKHFAVKKDRETLVIRLLEGDFPQYQDIMVNRHEGHVIILDIQRFIMMLKRMSILSTDDYKGVVFRFLKGKLLITSTNPSIGESKEEMVMDYEGPEINVSFNPKYFMDALNCIEDANVAIHIVNDEKPCFIEGESDKNFLSVVMPMRI